MQGLGACCKGSCVWEHASSAKPEPPEAALCQAWWGKGRAPTSQLTEHHTQSLTWTSSFNMYNSADRSFAW
jgi:hypothetical protein